MARKSKNPDPEPSPEERRLDEQIAREVAIKKRSREIQFACAKLSIAAERCRWTIQAFDRTPPYKFSGTWWRTFPWNTYTLRWVCGWHVLARRLVAFASTVGASPEDLVPTGDHLALELERPRVAFLRNEFLLVLRDPRPRDGRRNRAARLAAKIAGDHEGGYWDYYHTLFTLIGSEGEKRCNAALREIQATLTEKSPENRPPVRQSEARHPKTPALQPGIQGPPVLLPQERAVLDILLALPAGRGIVGSDILAMLDRRGFKNTSQSYLTTDIIPKLREIGLTIPNARGRRGYWIDKASLPEWVQRLPPAQNRQ